MESQPSILEIDRSVHRSLPAHARRGSLDRSGHGGGSIDRSGHRRRANRKGSLDSAASSLGSYNDTSVRVPLPLPQKTWRESKASDTKTFPESGSLRVPMMKNQMSSSVSMRTTILQTSEEVLPTTTATYIPSEDAKVEEIALVGGGREAMGPPCVHEEAPACSQQQVDGDEDAASVGAASLHSSSTSSGGLLLADYPRFRPSEVKVGQVLGKGSFGVVREVLAFDIDDEPQTSTAGGYQSTARFFAWASSGRSIASGQSIASGGSLRETAKVATRSASVDLIATSVDMAPPSSLGRTSNDAASRDAVTLFASMCSDGGSRDGILYTASLKDHSGGLFSSLREPGGQPVDEEKRVRRVSISEIAIHAGSADRDSEIKTDDFSSGPDHQHCNRKAFLNSSVGSMSHCQRRNRKASLDSTRTFQSGISSARSVAFGIDGRTFLARHCIRDVGKNAGNTSMRHVKSQNVFRRQQGYESRRSVESHGSHESASTGSISVTRSRVLARLGLAPSMSSSGGSRFVFKRKKKGLLRRKGEGDCRYAVKSLRDEVLGNPEVLEMALLDIQNETRILASVEHPNIVKMRAFSANDDDKEDEEVGRAKVKVNRGPRGYFIVLDRLYDTLEQRSGLWSHRLQKANRPTGWMTRSKVQREVWEQRLVVAYDLASALEYMHSMGIAYRDLVSYLFNATYYLRSLLVLSIYLYIYIYIYIYIYAANMYYIYVLIKLFVFIPFYAGSLETTKLRL